MEVVTSEAARIIAALGLEPLPREGGFFRQTWVSRETVGGERGARAVGSAIYFLLTTRDFSALHRLGSDELWCFHAGDPVEHVQLTTDDQPGGARVVRLGANVLGGDTPQLVVREGSWQGARLATVAAGSLAEAVPAGWALLSCTMAPAWDEREFELGEREGLWREFPRSADWIAALTR